MPALGVTNKGIFIGSIYQSCVTPAPRDKKKADRKETATQKKCHFEAPATTAGG